MKRFFMISLCLALAVALIFQAAGFDRASRHGLILSAPDYIERLKLCVDKSEAVNPSITDEIIDMSDEAVAARCERFLISYGDVKQYEYGEDDGETPSSPGGEPVVPLVSLSTGEILDLSTSVGRVTYLRSFDSSTVLKLPQFWRTAHEAKPAPLSAIDAIKDLARNIGDFFADLGRFLWNSLQFVFNFLATVYNSVAYLMVSTFYSLGELLAKFVAKVNYIATRYTVDWSSLGANVIPIDWERLYEEGRVGLGEGQISIPFVRNPDKYYAAMSGYRGGR